MAAPNAPPLTPPLTPPIAPPRLTQLNLPAAAAGPLRGVPPTPGASEDQLAAVFGQRARRDEDGRYVRSPDVAARAAASDWRA